MYDGAVVAYLAEGKTRKGHVYVRPVAQKPSIIKEHRYHSLSKTLYHTDLKCQATDRSRRDTTQ
jgi:hypothetical protein